MADMEKDQSQTEETVTIKHIRAAGYRSEYVNGVATAGPLGDRMMRVTFFRDALPEMEEVFDKSPGVPGGIKAGSGKPISVQIVREDVVTLIIPAKALANIGADFIRNTAHIVSAAPKPNIEE